MGAVEQVEVRLMGRPAIVVDGFRFEPPPGKGTAILLYLAFHGGWVGREELLYLFWADTPESRARGNLRPLLWRLGREAYGRGLESERTRVRWSVRTDVQGFRESFAARRWCEAWDLVGGELLAGFVLAGAPEFDRWLEAERAELRVVVRAAGARAVEELLATHDHAAAAAITGALHRDDPLEETVLRAHVAALAGMGARREALATFDRYRRTLEEEVGAEPEEATLALVASLRVVRPMDAAAAAPAVAVASERAERASMPVQATRLVGRVEERSAVVERLSEQGSRLVTIVGPGGVGKTRLAIEVASEVASRFRHGARFVDLVGVEALTAAIAQSVGVSMPGEGADVDHLLRHLRDKEMLLVLDNIEHLADDVALIEDILASAPSVTILATSRVRLALPGERLFDLAGLPFEGGPEGTQPDAVTLFRRCARRVRPDLEPSAAELRSVGRICALVEGLPLALELAATWLRVLTLAEIEAELEAGLDLLEEADRGAARRHTGMRAVFAHSWGLLGPRERAALRALAVFHGGWTREAATEVAGVGMPVLLALIDASLIRRLHSGRFTWHPLVGQYAARRAAEDGEARERVAARHARYYLELVAESEGARRRQDDGPHLSAIDVDMANVQAAWGWGVAHRSEELLASACAGLRHACFATNRLRLLTGAMRAAREIAAPGGRLRGRTALWLGSTLCNGSGVVPLGRMRESGEGLALLEEALSISEPLGADEDLARCLQELGVAYGLSGRVALARETLQRGLDLFRSLEDVHGVATMLSLIAEFEPDFEAAVEAFRAALEVATRGGVPVPTMMALEGLGSRLFHGFGAYEEAAAALERSAALSEQMGFSNWAHADRLKLALIEASGGGLEEARDLLEAELRGQAYGDTDDELERLAIARSLRGWVALLDGDIDAAAAWSRGSLSRQEAQASPETEAWSRTVLAALAILGGDLRGAAAELARARSRLEAVKRASFGRGDVPVGDVPHWLRLLDCGADLALADDRPGDAGASVIEALSIAIASEQQPAAAIALTAAARLLEARGDAAAARDLLAYVVGHVATPHDTRMVAERLGAGRQEGPGREAASWLSEHERAQKRSVLDVANDVLDALRVQS